MTEILYSDSRIIVAEKKPGMLSEIGKEGENTLPRALTAEHSIPMPHPIHRLDREVGGAMLLAKTSSAMSDYSQDIADGLIKKTYLAVVIGKPEQAEGELTDLLFHDKSRNKSYTVKKERRGVRVARLYYRVMQTVEAEQGTLSLIAVMPYTGRTHQIRVQFASRRLPLFGDGKYGGALSQGCGNAVMGLHCYRISFRCIERDAMVTVISNPPSVMPFSCFDSINLDNF